MNMKRTTALAALPLVAIDTANLIVRHAVKAGHGPQSATTHHLSEAQRHCRQLLIALEIAGARVKISDQEDAA